MRGFFYFFFFQTEQDSSTCEVSGQELLPTMDVMLFNFGTNTDFSVAETCFLSLTTLAKYQCFEESTKNCDIAIKYAALGLSFT